MLSTYLLDISKIKFNENQKKIEILKYLDRDK